MENAEAKDKKQQQNGDNNAKKTPEKKCEIDEHIMSRYDIKKRLGKGAYGIVYKAIDMKTNEKVAIKKIFDAFRNQTDAQRTYREIFFLQAFKKHPNIIKLHNIHRASNNKDMYLAFEYMPADLHNVIKCGNILKEIHKQYIMYQLLKATKYIHSGNVIHRDQKPSNILIDNACRVKIADFGLARSISSVDKYGNGGADPCFTDYVATRWYRAPEILIASRSYTKGVDMWSLGCILGEMVTGKPIFPGTSTVDQIERIMGCLPVPSEADIAAVCTGYGSTLIRSKPKKRIPLRHMLVDIPEEAISLISCLLVFNPAKRCSAAQALNHQYVAKFNHDNNDLILNGDVIPPLREDLRLSIDEYRNRIYGLTKRSIRVPEKESLAPVIVKKSIVVSSSDSNVKSASPPTKLNRHSGNKSKSETLYSNIIDKKATNSFKNNNTQSKAYESNLHTFNNYKNQKNSTNENGTTTVKKRNPLFKNHSMDNAIQMDSYTNSKCRFNKLKTENVFPKKQLRKSVT